MAIALGALGLLRDRMPRDLGSLSARHPAVILAVTATAGENVTNKILRKISAETLIHLQPPYGPAFRKLLANRSNVSCGDETVQLLARFGTRGLDQKQDLPRFLSGKDSSQNLQALAILYATDNVLARTFLEVLLKHPNMVIDNSYIQWGKDWDISAWSEIEPGDQLFVLSGIPPAGSVKIENVGKMFKHPSPVIRRYAIQQALDRIKFQHPGAFEAMSTLMKNPEMLSAEQLFKLAELLETPKNVTEERVRAWLESQPSPPVDLIAPLLLKTYQEKLGTKLDTWFAVYLKTKGWMPDIVSLRKLAQHPDQYTRLFAYDQIFKLKDESSAAAMLAAALVGEQEPSNRQQLEQMIAQLKR